MPRAKFAGFNFLPTYEDFVKYADRIRPLREPEVKDDLPENRVRYLERKFLNLHLCDKS